MAARFVDVSESQIEQLKENAVPQKTKDAAKCGVKLFKDQVDTLDKIFLSQKHLFQNRKVCLYFSPQRVCNFLKLLLGNDS